MPVEKVTPEEFLGANTVIRFGGPSKPLSTKDSAGSENETKRKPKGRPTCSKS